MRILIERNADRTFDVVLMEKTIASKLDYEKAKSTARDFVSANIVGEVSIYLSPTVIDRINFKTGEVDG